MSIRQKIGFSNDYTKKSNFLEKQFKRKNVFLLLNSKFRFLYFAWKQLIVRKLYDYAIESKDKTF